MMVLVFKIKQGKRYIKCVKTRPTKKRLVKVEYAYLDRNIYELICHRSKTFKDEIVKLLSRDNSKDTVFNCGYRA